MRYLLCVVLISVSTLGWAQNPDPASAATKVTKPSTSCEGKVLILRSGAWTCETVTGGTGTGTTYSFQPPMSESNGTVTIDLTPYATTTNVTGLLATKSDTSHTHSGVYQPAAANLTTFAGIAPSANAQTLLGNTFAQMLANIGAQKAITCPVSNQKWVTSIASDGSCQQVQPAAGDISGLGAAATKAVGTTSNTVAAGDDSRIVAVANKLDANGITSTGGTLTLPGSTGGDILIPDGGTAAANHLTSAATAILMWGTLPVAIGQGGEVTTGSVSGSGSAAVTLTWGTAFPGTTYKVNCNVIEATTSGSTLRVHHVESKSTTAVVVRVINDDTGAHTGTLSCLALN